MSAVRNAFQINTHNWPTAAVAVAHAFLHECDGGLISMAYRLKTFRVQFVAEPVEFPAGSPCRSSEGCRTSSAINLPNTRRRQRAFSFARYEQQEPHQQVQGRVNRKPYRVASPSTRGMANGALFVCGRGRFCSQSSERRSSTESRRSRNHSQAERNRRHVRDSGARSCRAWRWAILLV